MNVAVAEHAEEGTRGLEILCMDNSLIGLKVRARLVRDAVPATRDNMVKDSRERPENRNRENVAISHFHLSAATHGAQIVPQAGEIIRAAQLPVRRLVIVVQIGQLRKIDSVHGDIRSIMGIVFRGGLLSGTLRGNADISLAKNDPHYRANVSVNGINFPQLTDLYYNYKTAHGQLSGTYDFTGLGNDLRAMRGHGKVEVTNGDVFAIPIFGPLSGILNHVVPGSGYSIAHKASADFKINEGVIHTDDFEAAGMLFSMLGHGDIHFLDDKLDFNLRLNMKGPGVLLTPMYKLFEYTGEGSLKKPDWHSKRF